MSAAGVTVRLEPIARHRSAVSPSCSAFVSSVSGKFSPKLIIESTNGPLQLGSSHSLPYILRVLIPVVDIHNYTFHTCQVFMNSF